MIDLKALRRRISGQPNEQGVIGATCLYPHEARLLIAGLEAAEKDAARYRWIRKNNVAHGETIDRISQDQVVYFSFGLNGNNMDEAIDAAMASK